MTTYPLARPYITKREYELVKHVLDSRILSLGPIVQKFEAAFAKRIGVRYACAVNSGTSGLHLALLAAGIGRGDEVITSPFSFIASANSVIYTGARPVFVDVDASTGNMNPKKIERAITTKTKAILVVHIFGQPANMKPIMALARRKHLIVIEDACESLDATYHRKKAGTFGQSGVFAFYPNKQMTTGEGGIVVTNSQKIYDSIASLRNQGRDKDMNWLNHRSIGYNYRLDELSAAVGLAQLEKLTFLIRERQKITQWYTQELRQRPDLVTVPAIAPGNTHTWFVYVVRIARAGVPRDAIIKRLGTQGISSKAYLPSIHLFEVYRKMFHSKPGDFPISEDISARSLALPLYLGLTRKDVKFIARTLLTDIEHYGTHVRR